MTRTPGVPPYAERGGSNSSPRACWPPRWEQFRRAVLARLDPGVRAKTRGNVEAAALLDAMNSPQERLPHWRIVEPPPPPVLLGQYRYAARRIGAPWTYLAAIHLVETRMGRIRGVSSAGAQGPMQFLPTTWDIYGGGGDINDPRDVILAAARLLRANGAPDDMAGAVWHYNPSDNYVGVVTRYARAAAALGARLPRLLALARALQTRPRHLPARPRLSRGAVGGAGRTSG